MRAILVFAVLCLSWGTTWVAIRFGVTHAPPILFAGSRFLVAGLLLLGGAALIQKKLNLELLRNRFLYLTALMIIAATFGLIFWGEQYVSSGLTAVLVQGLIPISLPLFAAFYGREKLQPKYMISTALGIIGLVMTFGSEIKHKDAMEVYGVLALIVGTLIYCWGSIISKYNLKAPSVIELSGYQNTIGGLALLVIGSVLESEKIPDVSVLMSQAVLFSWLHLVFIGSIVGFTLYLYILKLWGAAKAASYAFVTPIIALLIDSLFLGASLSLREQLGVVFILMAVLVTFAPLPRLGTAAASGAR